MSLWRAKQFGGPELESYSQYIGWNPQAYILADLVDAVNTNTATLVAANSEGKYPKVEPYIRPGVGNNIPTESLEDFGGKLINLFGPGIAS